MDIQFDLEGYRLNVRTSGILIKNDKILLHKVEGDEFWGGIGGKVKINETSEHAILREFSEELKVELSVNRLLWIAENFFTFNNIRYHEYTFIYLLEDDQNQLAEGEDQVVETEKKKLIFRWFDKHKLHDVKIKPGFLNQEIGNIPSSIKHIVYHDLEEK